MSQYIYTSKEIKDTQEQIHNLQFFIDNQKELEKIIKEKSIFFIKRNNLKLIYENYNSIFEIGECEFEFQKQKFTFNLWITRDENIKFRIKNQNIEIKETFFSNCRDIFKDKKLNNEINFKNTEYEIEWRHNFLNNYHLKTFLIETKELKDKKKYKYFVADEDISSLKKHLEEEQKKSFRKYLTKFLKEKENILTFDSDIDYAFNTFTKIILIEDDTYKQAYFYKKLKKSKKSLKQILNSNEFKNFIKGE